MSKLKESIVLFDKKYDCCGCFACYSVCVVNAISMVEDIEGFLYPQIDNEVCVACRLCQKVCPCKNEENKK